MPSNHTIFKTGFGDQQFEIDCNNKDTYKLAAFLFSHFPGSTSPSSSLKYSIISDGRRPRLSLWMGERRLYYGESAYQLVYTLMNEVIYHCINTNSQHHALHAGSVHKDDQCIILPGTSGKGKSTVTAWLASNGFKYLTDELVFLSSDGMVTPLTRPINLKVSASLLQWLDYKKIVNHIIEDHKGSMIPHRLLNDDFSKVEPFVTHIIFPEYREDAELNFEKISPAKSTFYLLQSHVNARNLPGHGIAELSTIVRKSRSYKIIYSSFEDLKLIFDSPSGPF